MIDEITAAELEFAEWQASEGERLAALCEEAQRMNAVVGLPPANVDNGVLDAPGEAAGAELVLRMGAEQVPL
jgi:hypothetical protein